ncbi:MAG TPA: bifunctional 4-hydroxy-2-oxoglutarate aldolase/2-dehydro-3-deoxy-phosphogluconate aldolase [Chitinophagaceae bacterium]|nr:bifunctional 4-hydroxy-2-oxoglutarate aldolase/2-dehydro-3-deoxy-phosphogluconate aldolase [Chitinophagaceae bacterium]
MKANEIFQLAAGQGLIPPFNHADAEVARKLLDAAYAGGLRIIEFTNRSDNALEVFRELVRHAEKKLPDLVLGAGTILDEKQARQFYKAGARFLVSPVLNPEVGRYCEKQQLFWCPGAATPTEVVQAHGLGAALVKIFPAEVLGPAFVQALRGPCPWVRVMPSGGVTLEEDNLRRWFDAGVVCVAIGSQLFTPEITRGADYDLLTRRVEAVLGAIARCRPARP